MNQTIIEFCRDKTPPPISQESRDIMARARDNYINELARYFHMTPCELQYYVQNDEMSPDFYVVKRGFDLQLHRQINGGINNGTL